MCSLGIDFKVHKCGRHERNVF